QIIDSSGEASLTALCCGKAAPLNSGAKSYWSADLFPALKDGAKVTLRHAATPSGPTRFITISSEHFRVTYPADVARREADQVLSSLESTRADFLRRASSASINAGIPTLEIRLNDS